MTRLLQHPVVLALLCLSLVGTPITYRGGASNPHPHMFLEFLMDAEEGAFDHHHHDEESEPRAADDAAHQRDRTPVQEQSGPKVDSASDRLGASISAFVVGDLGQLASIVPQYALPQSDSRKRAFLPFDRPPAGITISPIAPPPR